MPRLDFRSFERNVQANLHDFKLRAEYALAHCGDPRMSRQIGKSPDRLRMNFDVPPARPATHGASRALNRFPKRSHHVLAKRLNPLGTERASQGRDPISIERIDMG